MEWVVEGATRDSGHEKTITIEAASESEARAVAQRDYGLFVASVSQQSSGSAADDLESARLLANPLGYAVASMSPPLTLTSVIRVIWPIVRLLMLLIGLLNLASGVHDGWQAVAPAANHTAASVAPIASAASALVQRALWNAALQNLSWGIVLIAVSLAADESRVLPRTS